MPDAPNSKLNSAPFWSLTAAESLKSLQCTPDGLTTADAVHRLANSGSQMRGRKGKIATLTLLLSQFKSPIILILLFAVGLSFFLKDYTNACIILGIVLMSGLL